jgi:ABC-type sugar transport system ATPase subunit
MATQLEFKNISMIFPGVKALDDVSFTARSGEVLALLGENGAGKSTLLKILNGDYQPSEGSVLLDGEELDLASPHDAIAQGISIIYQERQVVPHLSVAENIFMGHLPLGRGGLIDIRRLHRETEALLRDFHLPIESTDRVGSLSVAYQQMVEIMKACNHPKIDVIAFDEPTASLSDEESATLFAIIRRLKARGLIVIYVSHRLKELASLADRAVILKDGKFVAERPMTACDEMGLVNLMVGRDLGNFFDTFRRSGEPGELILSVLNLTNDKLKDVSFDLRAGEILGLGGLVGAGRTEAVRAIFGADPIASGQILLDGKAVRISSPEEAIRQGIALCPEDRKLEGIVPKLSIRENISMVVLRRLSRLGFVDFGAEAKVVEDGIRNLRIKTPNAEKRIVELSGGNQQKAILVRWLASKPRVLILDEPTKGIDVGTKAELYQIICDLAGQGLGIIFISSELTELIGISDRIVVMREGRISGELSRSEATEDSLLCLAMLGHKGRSGCDD